MSAQVAATVIGRPRMEPELSSKQRDHRVAEVHVLLALEGQGLLRVDDDARQARRVEHPFFEIELPGTALLRHEAPLQAIGEPPDDGGKMQELFVEIGAKPIKLFEVA